MSNPQILSKVVWRLRFEPPGMGVFENPVDVIPGLGAGVLADVDPHDHQHGPAADHVHAGGDALEHVHADDPTGDVSTSATGGKFGPLAHGDEFRINFSVENPGIVFLQATDHRTFALWNSATEVLYDSTIIALRLSVRYADNGLPGIGSNRKTYQFWYGKTRENGLHVLNLEEVKEEQKPLSLKEFINRPVPVNHDGAWHADDTGTIV